MICVGNYHLQLYMAHTQNNTDLVNKSLENILHQSNEIARLDNAVGVNKHLEEFLRKNIANACAICAGEMMHQKSKTLAISENCAKQ